MKWFAFIILRMVMNMISGQSLMESPWEVSPGPRLRFGDVHHVVADGVAAVVAAGVTHHLLLTIGAHFYHY